MESKEYHNLPDDYGETLSATKFKRFINASKKTNIEGAMTSLSEVSGSRK